MDMATALRDLGVTGDVLARAEKDKLDRDGFLPFEGILTPEEVAGLNQRMAELTAAEGDRAGLEVHQENGTDRLADLVNKDPRFEVCFSHPLRPGAMEARARRVQVVVAQQPRGPSRARGTRALHADSGAPGRSPAAYEVCDSIWLLDDFTPENGATRVVPGSHRRGTMPRGRRWPTRVTRHPDQIQLTGQGRTVVVFNSHLWHGGTLNRTDKPRRAMHSYFALAPPAATARPAGLSPGRDVQAVESGATLQSST